MKYKQVLWIDPAVRDYSVFVNSVNEDTLALVYPEPLRFDVERIGFVFEKHGPMADYLLKNADLLIGSGVKRMDFLACNTLPEWQPYYETLVGITVGASNHPIGNVQYGGDWRMDSTYDDVENIYFTELIKGYSYGLGCQVNSYIFKVGNILWGIGDNSFQQLGIPDASPTTFVDISSKQSALFREKKIIDFDWTIRNTIVTMDDGTVWMAGFSNDQYTQASNKEFVQVSLTINSVGDKITGKPILARLGRANDYVNDTSSLTYNQVGSVWIITQLNNVYQLYIYCVDNQIDAATASRNSPISRYFESAAYPTSRMIQNKWMSYIPSEPIQNIYLSVYCTSLLFVTSTNSYISTIKGKIADHGILTHNASQLQTYKLTNVSTITKAAFTQDIELCFFIQDGYVYAPNKSGYYERCLSNKVEISGVTHLLSNVQLQVIVTNNTSVWIRSTSGNTIIRYSNEFIEYPYNFGLIKEIGIYFMNGADQLLIYSNDGKVYDAATKTVISTLESVPHVYRMDPPAASINASVNLYVANFDANNATYLYVGTTYTQISVISTTQIQFKVPENTPSLVSLDLYSSLGVIPVTTTFRIYPFGPLSSYNTSVVFPRQCLQIFGANLYNVSYVQFGTQSVFPVNVSRTQINVSVPLGLPDQVEVKVVDIYNNVRSMSASLDIMNLRVTSIDPLYAPRKSTIQLTGNFSNISVVRFGTRNASFQQISQINLSVRVPEGIPQNCSIVVYDIYGNNVIYKDNFKDTTFTLSQFTPTTMFKTGLLDLSGTNFSNISEVRFGSLNASFTLNTSINLVTEVPPVLTNCSIEVIDFYGNKIRYGSTFTVTNLSYAFQVENILTLVGTGLTGRTPDMNILYNSNTAPMFTETRQGSIALSTNGLTTDTVPIYPVTVIQTNLIQEEIVTVRGMPYGKIPDRFGVYYA